MNKQQEKDFKEWFDKNAESFPFEVTWKDCCKFAYQAALAKCEEREKKLVEVFDLFLSKLSGEISRGKEIDCIGCLNGLDIPAGNVCAACYRYYHAIEYTGVKKEMYLILDYKTTEMRISDTREALRKLGYE